MVNRQRPNVLVSGESIYDDATLRRIDRQPRRRVMRRAPLGARAMGSGALMTAVALGLQHVFDPPDDDEIVMEIDLAGEGHDDQPVVFDYDPTSVHRSRAHVRPWLLAAAG